MLSVTLVLNYIQIKFNFFSKFKPVHLHLAGIVLIISSVTTYSNIYLIPLLITFNIIGLTFY